MRIYYYLFLLSFLLFPIIGMEDLASPKVNVHELQVKSQFDEDGGGVNSCGYHALKNGVVVLKSLLKHDNISDKAKKSLVSSKIIDNFFGSKGEWRKVVNHYRNKQVAKDYIYNYLLFNINEEKEHILTKDENSNNDNNIFALRLNLGYLKFKTLSSTSLALKDLLLNVAAFLTQSSNIYDIPTDQNHEEIRYNIDKDRIFECICYMINTKSSNRYANIELTDVEQTFLNIQDIIFSVNNGDIETQLPVPAPAKTVEHSNNINFSDNLNSKEIEIIIENYLEDYPIFIVGDKGLHIRAEAKRTYNHKLNRLVWNIKNQVDSTAVFLVYENNHWYTCVVKAKKDSIDYYLANSASNISVKNYSSFEELRDLLEDKHVKNISRSNLTRRPPLDSNNRAASKEMFNLNKDERLESILNDLRSPYSSIKNEELPKIDSFVSDKIGQKTIRQTVYALKENTADLIKHIGIGLILQGPPGTGKTLLAEVMARNSERESFFIGGGTMKTKYQGSGPEILDRLFKKAAFCSKPSCIIIDEFDAIAESIEGRYYSPDDALSLRCINTYLDTLSNYENPPYIICTTNHLGKIDQPIEDRFRTVFVDKPNVEKLAKVIKYILIRNKKDLVEGKDFTSSFIEYLAKCTQKDNFNCRDIDKLVHNCLLDQKTEENIDYSLPWSYTKLVYSGTELEKYLYNAYQEYLIIKSRTRKEREEKEKQNKTLQSIETERGSLGKAFDSTCSGLGKVGDGILSGIGMSIGSGITNKTYDQYQKGNISIEAAKKAKGYLIDYMIKKAPAMLKRNS